MEVGIRELKQKLSAYLDKAAAGERVFITDRGQIKAILIAPDAENALQKAVDDGRVASPPRRGSRRSPPRRARSTRTIADVLSADRERT